LTAIQYPDNSFDAIYCSHVLEHIPDDRAAMRELFRVLKPGGWAILQVPLDSTRETTYEDPSITSFEARERAYWQADHVRLYGRDYTAKLESTGFRVRVDWFVKTFTEGQIHRFGLDKSEGIHWCEKPLI
jgi:ubiquinone/menaquinone biosynthesis C-methylase UbiE